MPINCNCFTNPADISNGQPVDEQTLQPILEALYQNDVYLKGILDYFQAPSGLTKCVTVNTNVQVGQPVYYSNTTGAYEKSAYGSFSSSKRVILSESAETWGIVLEKKTADTALILVDGIAKVDLTASFGAATHSGRLYLGTTPGTLVETPPNDLAPVYVLSAVDDGYVLFRPYSGENSALILQWKHKLVSEAAGTVVVAGSGNSQKLQINSPNKNLPGWLPVSQFSNAPAGAVFGYNIDADLTLKAVWPPKYLSTMYMEMDRGLTADVGATGVSLGVGGMCQIDNSGIWWFSDCVVDCPFDPIARAPGDPGVCPRELFKTVTIYAARPAGSGVGVAGLVSSLRSAHPALKVLRRDTQSAAENGDLDLQLALSNLIAPSPTNGAFGL
ncbi:MAG: hypothetical protein EBZ77_10035, partial [Chitinophagia bacterium]|nr:hypothetical protein [Chitinophagia bacterium]